VNRDWSKSLCVKGFERPASFESPSVCTATRQDKDLDEKSDFG